ncbi:MAG: methyl-accepting chemotaxis protein [Burkholderiales bacterium]|nr:methyl-accepting chemotaxis protein [Burkholderiales bacterium]
MLVNFTIGTRLQVLVVALSLFLVGVGISGLLGMSSMKERLRSVYEDRTVALEDLHEVTESAYRSRGRIDAALMEGADESAIRDLAKVDGYLAAMRKAWDAYMSTGSTDEEKALQVEVARAMDVYVDAARKVTAALQTQSRASAIAAYHSSDYVRKMYEFRDLRTKLVGLQVRVADEDYKAAGIEFRHLQVLAIGAIVCGVLLNAGIAWLIIRSITLPLRRAVGVSDRIAQGDLSESIEAHGRDEAAQLLKGLARMQDALRTLVKGIQTSSERLSAAAAELAAASNQVSESSSSQSESAASMAASVEEMTVSINHISERARETQEVSTETGRLSREGAGVVRRSADEMERIAETVNHSAQSVRKLGETSKQIAEIVNVIRDIADQTNLLALNAAIEAARAGEQGRGFAVVADEVRKLSEKTSGSTTEIVAMVQAIAEGTQDAVTSMERGVVQVEEGVALAREAGHSIVGIEGGSEKLLAAVSDISDALKEQSQASNEIARHVERIAQMTEENSLAIRQTTSASQSLEELARSLQRDVSQFRVAAA